MRLTGILLGWLLAAVPVHADSDIDRLVDAIGLPALIEAFSEDGMGSAAIIDDSFLAGQGGDVFYETVRRLHDPQRLEADARQALKETLDPAVARQAFVFFDSAQGQDIITLEVQARQAMIDDELEEAVKGTTINPPDAVLELLSTRDLVETNTDIAMAAQFAFFDGLQAAVPSAPVPDLEAARGRVAEDTRAWVTGYYMLVASALDPDDMDTYIAFWETDVGEALDAAMLTAFQKVFSDLSYALGQTVGQLLPQNEL